jgi:DNA modification methylase
LPEVLHKSFAAGGQVAEQGGSMRPYFEESGITIYHGDCREILPQLGRFDLLLTDPPYGIDVDMTMHKQGATQTGKSLAPKRTYDLTNWDSEPPTTETLEVCIAAARSAIIFGGNYFNLGPARCFLVWDKETGAKLVAAKSLGILATGIDAEERYCEIAANRLRQSVLQFEEVSA